jgi:RNA polymerase sigma-70 factor (sigma-E family)
MKRFDGFTEFVATHNAALSRLAYLLSGNHTDAQDLLQTALTKTATRWGQVARYDSPAAFTRRVMINEATSFWRRARRARHQSRVHLPDRPGHPHDEMGQAVTRLTLRQALERLSARQRAVLILRYFEDLSVEETAVVLGCSAGTVKSHTFDALSRLRALAPELADLKGQS